MNWPKKSYEHQTLARGVLEQSRFSNPAQLNETVRSSNGTLSQDEESKNGVFQQYGGPKSFPSSSFNHLRDPKTMMGQTPVDTEGGVQQPFPNSPFQRSPFPMQAFQQQHPIQHQQLQQHLHRQQQQQQMEHQLQQQMRQQQFMKQKQMAQQHHMQQQQQQKAPQYHTKMQQGLEGKMPFLEPSPSYKTQTINGNDDEVDNNTKHLNTIHNTTNKHEESIDGSRKDGEDEKDEDNDDIVSTDSRRSEGRMDGRIDGLSPGGDNEHRKNIPTTTNEDSFLQGHPGANSSKLYPPHSSTYLSQQYPPHHNFSYFQHMQQQRMKGDRMGGVRFMRGPSHHTMTSPPFRGTPPDLRAFYPPSNHPSHHPDLPTQQHSHTNQQSHSIHSPHNHNTNQPHNNNPSSHLQRILQSNNYPSPNLNLGISIKAPPKHPQPPPQQQTQHTAIKGDEGDEDDDSKNTSEDTIGYEDEDGVKTEKSSRSKTKNDNGIKEADDGGGDDEDDDDTVDGNTTEDDTDVKREVGETSEKYHNSQPSCPPSHNIQPPPYHPQQHPYPISSMPALISQNNFNNHSNQPPNNQPNILTNHPSNYPFNHSSNHPFNYHPSHLAYPQNHPFPQKRYYDGEPIRPPDSFNPHNYPPIRGHPHQFPHDFMPQNYPPHHHRMPPHQSFLPQRPPHPFHHKMNGGGMDGWRKVENISSSHDIKPPSADSYDESSTSDTQMSFPGKSDQHQQDDSDRPHKKMKFDHTYIPIVNYTDPRQINLNMQRYTKNEAFNRLMEMANEPERGVFLLDLFSFMEERNTAITTTPTVSKQPLDLFKLYCIVKQFGGMVEVSKNKRWRDVSAGLKMGSSSSAGFVVKKNYGRFVFPFECMRDRGNIDPVPILAYLEQPLKKSSKRNNPEKSILDHPNLDPRVDFHSPRPSETARRLPPSSASQFSQYNSNQQHPFPSSNHHPNQSTIEHSMPSHSMNRGIRPNLNTDFEHLRMGLSPHKRAMAVQAQKESSRFPSGCVEGTHPIRRRIKKLNLKVLGQVDTWRIMMALRSGLLTEASWALNLLTALLADNQATSQLKLANLPGLLGVLISHLKSSLKALFVKDFQNMPTLPKACDSDACKRAAKMDWDYYSDFKGDVELDKVEFSNRKFGDGRRKRMREGCVLKDDRHEEFFMWDDKTWDGVCCGEDVVTHMEARDRSVVMMKQFYGGREVTWKNEDNDGDVKDDDEEFLMSINEEKLRQEEVCSEVQERLKKGGYMKDDLSGGRYSEGVSCVEVENLHREVFNSRDDFMLQMERRCLQIVNIFRSLSFIPGNEHELSKNDGFLFIVAKLMLLGHVHKTCKPSKSEGNVYTTIESCIGETSEVIKHLDSTEGVSLELCVSECSWRTYESLREDALVIMANIAGRLELCKHGEEVVLPLLEGLLHWCTCPSSQASDADVARTFGYSQPEPGAIQPSFSNLALEAASKLCVVDSNVDLLVVTPPFSRLLLLIKNLCSLINHGAEGDHHFEEEIMVLTSSMSHLPSSNPAQQSFLVSNPDWMNKQVSREFSLVLVACLLHANKSFAKVLSLDRNFVSSLFKFIEVQCLRLNLCILTSGSTSSDDQFSAEMLRKAALILLDVANHTDQVACHKQRLLSLIYDKMPPSCDEEEEPSTSRVNPPKNKHKNLPCILNEVLLSLHSK